jgi:hypothetical protein
LLHPSHQRQLLAFLSRPRAPLWIALLSALLLTPCLVAGLVTDDFVLAVKAAPDVRMPELPPAPLSLFTFTTGDPQQNAALMDEGALLPWWSAPHHLNAFFRPLSSATHWLDFWLWPKVPALMHLHSLLWYIALVALLYAVYRTLEPDQPLLAAFALLLYAIDDAHGATVGWISNRNALISAGLALPALALHHRALRGERAGYWLGPLCFGLGLCAGETAICVLGYLLAYALCLDPRKPAARIASLAPYLALLIAHRVLYHVLHLGSFGSSGYHDPAREPLAFAGMLVYNLPVLLSAELLVPLADLAFWGDVRLRGVLWLWSVASVAALAWFAWPLLKRDARARFWCVGFVLAAIPVSASLPGERLLIAVGFGAAPVLARLLVEYSALSVPAVTGLRRVCVFMLVVMQLHVAAVTLPLRACSFWPLHSAIERLEAGLPRQPSVSAQTAVVLNAPYNVMVSYLQIMRAWRRQPRPEHLYWLASSSSEIAVTRVGPRSLRVTQQQGFLYRPEETHYRSNAHDLPAGTELARAGMAIRVEKTTADGRPQSVLFRFDEPLESKRYLFRAYRDGELVPWQPPAAGGSDRFAPQAFFKLMLREVLR